MDADSGTLLYSKGGDEIRYPASITKIMTLLLAVENCSLKEDVVFTETGTRDISWDSGNIGMQVGEVMSMRACLYALVIRSANEVAAQIAEHVGGTEQHFVDMMNERAEFFILQTFPHDQRHVMCSREEWNYLYYSDNEGGRPCSCQYGFHSTVQLWLSKFHKSTGKWWRSISSKRSDCG